MTPLAMWNSGLEKYGSPTLPRDEDLKAMVLDFLPFKWRHVSREGIHIFGEKYFHPELGVYLEQKDRRLRVKYDPEDISVIFVELPDGDHFVIRHPELSNVSRLEHKVWRAERIQPQSKEDRRITLQAIGERERVVKRARDETRRARRSAENVRIPAPQQFANAQIPDPPRGHESPSSLNEDWKPNSETSEDDEWEIDARD